MTIYPFVSVVMPVRNEAKYIERSLGAILAQDYPAERFEVLVVDGMSGDGTQNIVQQVEQQARASRRATPAVHLLSNPDQIAPTAFNIGIERARGDVVIIVGGHCELARDYLRQCVEVLEETGAECVGGPMKTAGETAAAQAIAQAQSSSFGVGGIAFRTGRATPGYVDTVAFGAYRREVFDRIGDFDEELVRNQDDELNFRLTQAGGKIWLDPSIQSVYYSRASLGRLWRQYYDYGLYKVRVIQKRGAVPAWRHLVPATFVLALVVSLLLAVVTRQTPWFLSVVGPYLAATLAASVWVGRRDWRSLPLLPIVYPVLHLSYGLGFLAGLWRWRQHWGHQSSPRPVLG